MILHVEDKITKVRVEKEVVKHFFGNSIVNLWNSLPEMVVTHPPSFKNRLDTLWNGY